MTEPVPGYVTNVPSHPPIHNRPPRPYQWQNLSQDQLAAIRAKLLESFLQVVVQAVSGLFVPGGGIGGALDQLEQWAQSVPAIATFVELLTGIVGGTGEDLQEWAQDLLTIVSPLNALNLFNLVVPIGSITNTSPNILPFPGFDDVDSIHSNPLWFWDDEVGNLLPGSVYYEADGVYAAIRSDDIAVADDMKFIFSVKVYWEDLVFTDDPIQLKVRAFDADGVVIEEALLDAFTPLSSSSDPDTWTELSANSDVPTGATTLQLRLVVAASATSGTVWFDDASAQQTGLILEAWVDGLAEKWQALFDIFAGVGGTLTKVGQAWVNFLKTFGIVDLSALADIDPGDFDPTDILNYFFEFVANPLEVIEDAFARLTNQDITDRIFSAFNNLGENLSDYLGQDSETVLGSVLGIFESALGAHKRLADAEDRLAALESVPTTIVDTFNRDAAASLGSGWTTTNSESGSGTLITDGSGNAAFSGSGTGNRTSLSHYNTTVLPGDNCVITVMFTSNPEDWTSASVSPSNWIIGRANTANTTMIRLRFYQYLGFWVQLQAVVSSVVTDLGSPVSLAGIFGGISGKTYKFYVGATGGSSRNFKLYQDGTLKLNVTDGSNVSTVGASNRFAGIGARATSSLLRQIRPGKFGTFNAEAAS